MNTFAAVAIVLVTVGTNAALGQTSSPIFDSPSTPLRTFVQGVVTASDAKSVALRIMLHLPATTASQVTFLTSTGATR
jgi:hypothetical protein